MARSRPTAHRLRAGRAADPPGVQDAELRVVLAHHPIDAARLAIDEGVTCLHAPLYP
jgi:hypothetical protein